MADENNRIPEDEIPEGDAPEELEEGDLIEMYDDEGNAMTFVFIGAVEYEDDCYVALTDQEEEDAVFFLKIEQDEDGNDVYTAPSDELEDKLFERFMEIYGEDEEEE